jgi:hypothetical protein
MLLREAGATARLITMKPLAFHPFVTDDGR